MINSGKDTNCDSLLTCADKLNFGSNLVLKLNFDSTLRFESVLVFRESLNMSGTAYDNQDSNDSFDCSEGSIVSSEVFGKQLASKLKEIKPIPVVTLDGDKPSTSNGKGENVRKRLQTLASGWNEWDGKVPPSKVIPDQKVGGNRYEKMEMRDPLPKSTAFGLCSIDRKSKDTSPYPPPDPTQGRFNCSFPAPKPIDESELPHYNRVEFFLKAQEWVEKDIQKSNNDKAWFESFIKEKIQFNVADTNLDK